MHPILGTPTGSVGVWLPDPEGGKGIRQQLGVLYSSNDMRLIG